MTEASAEALYHDVIMDRARRPRHQQVLEAPAEIVEERNPLCGDRVLLHLRRDPEGRVAALGYQARACAICVAATDLMAEIVPGMTAPEVEQAARRFHHNLRGGADADWEPPLAPLQVFAPLSTVPSRITCALLPFTALTRALGSR